MRSVRKKQVEPDPRAGWPGSLVSISPASVWRLAREHVPLLVSAVTLMVTYLRVLAAAGFNTSTALALANSTSSAQLLFVLTQSALTVASAFGFGLLLSLWSPRQQSSFSGGRLERDAFVVLLLVLVAALLPAVLFIAGISWMGLELAARLHYRRLGNLDDHQPRRKNSPLAWRALMAALVFLVIAGIALGRDPWLPREAIEIQGDLLDGYVVSDSNGWTTVLTHEPRQVVRFPSSSMTSRKLCQDSTTDWWEEPAILLFGRDRPTEYPPCSE